MRRLIIAGFLLAVPLTALAQEDPGGGIDVIDVSGPLDASALEFMSDSIEAAADSGQELAVLQINSRAVLDALALDRLWTLVSVSGQPLPVAVWVGPEPAVAYGGVGSLLALTSHGAMAPGTTIGRFEPVVLGQRGAVLEEVVAAEDSGFELQPTLRQFLQDLDGRTFDTAAGPVTVSTLEDFEGGVTVKDVVFRKPGLGTRFFRLAVTPEAAFFFLVVGLSLVTFEFFALGPGVASAIAGVSLLLAGWGVVTLPVRWWALALAVIGWLLLTAAHQKGGVVSITVVGVVLLQVSGTWFIAGQGQIDPRWYLVLPSVLAVLFFFVIAMPTVQRSRLSTETIGRESLIGLQGTALVDFDPDGLVEVGGARWRATAHREAGLTKGVAVVVTGVDGLFLEVDGLATNRET